MAPRTRNPRILITPPPSPTSEPAPTSAGPAPSPSPTSAGPPPSPLEAFVSASERASGRGSARRVNPAALLALPTGHVGIAGINPATGEPGMCEVRVRGFPCWGWTRQTIAGSVN
jgi:hypothetical protein